MQLSACDMLTRRCVRCMLCWSTIPLGLGPSLRRLRSGSLRLVRRFHRYYGLVRLPASVHHRLRLLTFPMRTRSAHGRWSEAGSPRFQRDPFARDVLFDPGRVTAPRVVVLLMLRSAAKDNLRPQRKGYFEAQSHTPRNSCVRFAADVTAGLAQHSLPGGSLRLTWTGLPPVDRASFLAHPLPTLRAR